LPAGVWPFTRHGLIINETKVILVTWTRGSFTKVAEFLNDASGLTEFSNFMRADGRKFAKKSFNLCVNLIGEDYRFEKCAHLVGKYRSDMLKSRFQKLFRGTLYNIAEHQGREALGQRQDYFLFCGVLSNDKVQPWVRDLARFSCNVAGVHIGSMLPAGLVKGIIAEPKGINVVSFCLEDGSIRHNFYIDGKLRFSRVSRGKENALPEEIFRLTKSEIDKTSQYLASLKMITPNTKVASYIVCADDIFDALKELGSETVGERVQMKPVAARVLGDSIGIKRPLDEYGRDSSLLCQEMFRSFRFKQMAAFETVRFYFLQTAGIYISLAAVGWGLYNLTQQGLVAYDSFNRYSDENRELAININQLRSDYQNLVAEFVEPPSTSENMRASVNVLDHVVDIRLDPGKIMLFVSKELEQAPPVVVDNIEWFVSNDPDAYTGEYAYANGRKYFEVLVLEGELDDEYDSEYAYALYSDMVRRINDRPDMELVEYIAPSLVEAGGNLVGSLEQQTDIKSALNAYQNRNFRIRVAWDPHYDPENPVNPFADPEQQS
jgi:hypothetical protein